MIGILIALVAAAPGANASYGQSLLDEMHRRHPEISEARVTATNGQGQSIALDHHWPGRSRSSERRTLVDANGNQIGELTLGSRCARLTNADTIESELSRRIYSSGSLVEPDPFVAGAIRAPNGQRMIDDALERDPGIITLAFHVTPPNAKANMIVASSFGRIGKPGDADDEQVIRDGKTLREITNSGKRVAIELPLLDAHGHVIGALSTSFRREPGMDAGQIEKRAVTLRDSFGHRTPSLTALFRPATASRQVGALQACHR